MDNNQTPRVLSHDEKNAADAAFSGRPLNPKWSARARSVYEGIIKALPSTPETAVEDSNLVESTATPIESIDSGSIAQPEPSTMDQTDDKSDNGGTVPTKIPFEQALATGALIDVTPTAKELGFSFPVTVTKPLWEVGIAPSQTLTKEEQSGRLRDVLMAFRLRLATQQTISPLIDFPALLAFPPSNVPQPIPLFALIQPDEQNRAMVTLLLPNEVAATIIPLN
jgi:Family of unknown function (DUF6573)